MTLSLEEVLDGLPEERRRRINQRAAELIAEELHLRELHRLRNLLRSASLRSSGLARKASRALKSAPTSTSQRCGATLRRWAASYL